MNGIAFLILVAYAVVVDIALCIRIEKLEQWKREHCNFTLKFTDRSLP